MKQEAVTEVKGRRAAAEFNGAPAVVREQFWKAIADQAETVHLAEIEIGEGWDDPEAGRRAADYVADNRRVAWGETWRRRCLAIVRARRWPEDDLRGQIEALRDLPAPAYFASIAGVDVPENGGQVLCPLHEERTPSCKVWPDERGWYCFGCQQGGGAVELAAAVWDLSPRGNGFVEIVKRLGEVFGG